MMMLHQQSQAGTPIRVGVWMVVHPKIKRFCKFFSRINFLLSYHFCCFSLFLAFLCLDLGSVGADCVVSQCFYGLNLNNVLVRKFSTSLTSLMGLNYDHLCFYCFLISLPLLIIEEKYSHLWNFKEKLLYLQTELSLSLKNAPLYA